MTTTQSPDAPATSASSRLFTAGQALVSIGAVVAIGAFLVLAILRLGYKFELEWLESEMLAHVRKLVDGEPLYTPPTITETQLPYAPLSFGFGAVLSEVFGVHFWVMRAVSIVATAGTIFLLFKLVFDETRSRFAGFVAAGTYAAAYRLTGTFYDVAKSDALFIWFAVASFYCVRKHGRLRNAVIGALLMALAILTKQTALFFFVPVALYLLVFKWRFGIVFTAITTFTTALTTAVLHLITDGWFTFYNWELLFGHAVVEKSRETFFTEDMLPFWPTLVVVSLAAKRWSRRDQWSTTAFYSAVCSGLFIGAFTGRLHSGGYDNVLMPAALAMAMLLGLATAYVASSYQRSSVHIIAVGLCALQLAFLRYDFAAQLPTKADERTGNELLAIIRSFPGPVWLARHPEYASMVGKPSLAGQGGIEDILRGTDEQAKVDLQNSIASAIHSQRFDALIFDDLGDTRGFPSDWGNYYELSTTVALPDDGTFRPVVNGASRPKLIYVKRPLT